MVNEQKTPADQELDLATPVESVMSRSLLTVAESESVLLSYELATRAGVHHLPVMSSDGHYVGLVALAQLERWVIGPLDKSRPTIGELADRRRIEVAARASMSEAALQMDAHDLDAVVVTDDDHLVGLLSWRDVIRFVAGTSRPDHAGPHTHPILFTLEPVLEGPDRTPEH